MQKFPLCSFIFSLLFGMAAAAAADCKGINGVSNFVDETSLSGKTAAAAAWVGKGFYKLRRVSRSVEEGFLWGYEKLFQLARSKRDEMNGPANT